MRSNSLQLILGCHLAVCLLMTVGCERQNPSPIENPYLGNMNDHSWGGLVEPGKDLRRVNANGRYVSVSEFKGKFLWTDYAAPWCQPCVPQAQAIKSLETVFGGKVVFLTVMTANSSRFEDVADQQTAKNWAQRFGLNPEQVVAATNLWSRTIPTHILFSPAGQMLYQSTGALTASQIQAIASKHMQAWEG